MKHKISHCLILKVFASPLLLDLGQGRERRAEHQQWQMVGVECMEGKAQAHGLLKVLNIPAKPTGSTVIIQPNQ